MDYPFEQCPHCGLHHPRRNLQDIADHCMAVKKIEVTGYVYDKGSTVSVPHVKSVEYFDPDQQRKLFEEAINVNR